MKKKSKALDNKGAAMLMVLIVSAVVLVFCLSLLLLTYSLFAQTSRQTTRVQCKLLAQSCEETLKAELQNPSSELSLYLKQQIQSENWIEEGRLPLHLDTQGGTGDYRVSISLTYSVNIADDDGGDDGGDDNDDQDHDLNGDPVSGGNAKAAAAEGESSTGYSIKAVIRCTRGEGTDRDTQYYEIETTFPNVVF